MIMRKLEENNLTMVVGITKTRIKPLTNILLKKDNEKKNEKNTK